jgi:hypothetical protein
MNIKLVIIVLGLISFLTLPMVVSANTVTPGVSVGDVFNYNYTVSWNSTNTAAKTPDYVTELTKIQSFEIRITSISGTTVNAEFTYHYHDGTSKAETGYVDLQSGAIHLEFGYLMIAGNSNANDLLYPSGGDAKLNSSSTRTFSSGERTIVSFNSQDSYPTSYEEKNINFDKVKGVAVDYHFLSSQTVGSATETFEETITNSNSDAWAVIPEFPVLLVPLLLLGATTLFLIASKKKNILKPF